MVFVNERKEDGQWQTIDRERGIALIDVSGPDKEGNYFCRIIYEGHTVRFDAMMTDRIYGKPRLGEKRQYDMYWQIFRLFIPAPIKDEQQDIQDSIKEALESWGWNFSPDKAHSVQVNFVPGMFLS